ncbi:MAG TPA: hypothetical protein VGA44_10565, partial [Steroidobacteraceae bacterium]
ADALITCWDSKYHYSFWRPETAIREGDNDLNRRTVGDPTWLPFLSPSAGLTVNPRQYHHFSEAAQEVVEVRILQGIHFRFAAEQARRQGRRVAHWTFKKVLKPLPGTQ